MLGSWRAAHPEEAEAVDALDQTLDRLAFVAPPDLDVEGALRKVKARRAAEAAGDASRVLPLRAAVQPPRPASARRWYASSGVQRAAAVLLVVAGAAAVWVARRGHVGTGAVAARPLATLTTKIGARDSIRFSDGTRVLLGPGSTLEIVSSLPAGRREVRLRGEAYFDVRHDEAHPFVVHTAAASIRDVGTSFTVRDGSDGRVTVAVTGGRVELRSTGSAADSAVVLGVGDRGTLVPGAAPTAERAVVTDDDLGWTRGQLSFRDASFPEVAAELHRWYGVELRAADPALAQRHLTAAFHGETVNEVLRVVGLALGASVERRGDTAFVRP
jgi:transmembrane sensor